MSSPRPLWTEYELRRELSHNLTRPRDRLLRNVDAFLFDTRLRNESLEGLLYLIKQLPWAGNADERTRFVANLERVLVDTRLSPVHSPLIVTLLTALRACAG